MANEMNAETLKDVLAITSKGIEDLGTINGADPTEELKDALRVLVKFAEDNETGVEDFYDTLGALSTVIFEIAESIQESPEWAEWMLQDSEETEESIHAQWRENCLPFVVAEFGQDECALTQSFNEYTDSLCTEGAISKYRLRTMDHPKECGE